MKNAYKQRPASKKPAISLRSALLRQRYLLKDDSGKVIESPDQMLIRVAKAIAAPEAKYGASPAKVGAVACRFLDMMKRGVFLPNSPTLMNAGHPNAMLSACFVLGVDDSIDGIFSAMRQAVMVQAAGGGTGFAFDTLRPSGDLVRSNGGQSSGPIAFWRVFAEATNAIQQGAHRRGANMGMMAVDHPDILKFTVAKQTPTDFTNFNISVKVTDSFMERLKSHPDSPHVVINPRTGKSYWLPKSFDLGRYTMEQLVEPGRFKIPCFTVGDVWRMIITSAHTTGEPGICLIDRVNRDNPTPSLGPIRATNPCGEQPLLAGEACNLGSINLSRLVLPDGRDMDWARLRETVNWAVRFLDNVIDANHYPGSEIQEVTLGNRKIGLGVMGMADALILRGLRYDSGPGLAFASKVMAFVQDHAHAASQDLAEERGSFPNWRGSLWDVEHHRPMRNASCTTIAPTGSLSVIASCSSGIEPIYRLAFRRTALDGRAFIQVHPLLEVLGRRGKWMTKEVREALLNDVPMADIRGIPDSLKRVLVTAHEVPPEWHVRMQAAVQQQVDNAVSKTVNLPGEATVQDVDKVFRMAHDLDCKGITVYRDGSRSGQTLSSTKVIAAAGTGGTLQPRPRGRVTRGVTSKFRMGCGTLFVTVNRDNAGLCEVFANLGKAGGCPSQSEATCRAVSAALRSGVDPKAMVEQLRGIRCLSTCLARKAGDGIDVLSCPDAIARALEEAYEPQGPSNSPDPLVDARACPYCGGPLRWEQRCWVCLCGYSACG